MNDVELLRVARERVSTPRKWKKGWYSDHHTRSPDRCRVCVLGALNWAVHGNPDWIPDDELRSKVSVAQQWLAMALPWNERSLSEWNDSPRTHHADVLAAFDKAIEMAEAAS